MKNGGIFSKICEGYLTQTEMDFDSCSFLEKHKEGVYTHTHTNMCYVLLYVNTAVSLSVTSDGRFCVAESGNTEL